MAFVALNIAPDLRPWRSAGITHLLCGRDISRSLCPAAALPVHEGRGDVPSGGASPSSLRASASRSDPAGEPRIPRVAASPPDAGEPAPDGSPPFAAWPQLWQELWRQAAASAPGPAAVWTYDALGTDLRGQPSAPRRAALQRLLADLRLPRGSHAFWPYCLPPDNIPEPDMFMAGLLRFRPGLALLLGSRAAADLAGLAGMPGTLFQTGQCRGVRCILLPDVETVDSLSGRRREQLLALVRASVM